jgi:CDP-diacylglycerol--glycerol-3-phosphate 3-phosphatidyltransferase
MLERKAREISRPTLEAVGRTLARWKITPDGVTYAGLLLTLGVAVLISFGELRWAGVAYIFAAACDALDGALARVTGKGSRFGAFLDSTIDRFEESLVFLGLTVHYTVAGSKIEPSLVLAAAIASLMVSYTRARAEAVGVACTVGLSTRPARVALMIAGLLLNQVLVVLAILAVTSLFTAFQRMVHVWRATGGQATGWAAPKTPYKPPDPPADR